jgi:hypothetical protein
VTDPPALMYGPELWRVDDGGRLVVLGSVVRRAVPAITAGTGMSAIMKFPRMEGSAIT